MTDQTVALPGAVALEPPSTVLNPETVTTSGGGKVDSGTQDEGSIESVLETELSRMKADDAKAEAETKAKADDAAKDAKAKADEAAKGEKKDEPKPDRQRADDGKFSKADKAEEAAKADAADKGAPEKAATERSAPEDNRQSEGRKYAEAPARLLPEERAKWANVPNEVKAGLHRLTQEMEQENAGYKQSHERYTTLKPYDDLARTNGRDLRESLERITHVERAIAQNPITGLDMVLREIGPRKQDGTPLTLMEVAQHIVQNPQAYQQASAPIQTQQQPSPEIEQLRAEIQSMKAEQTIVPVITRFAEAHPDFQSLEPQIAELLDSGVIEKLYGKGLSPEEKLAEAYRMAGGRAPSRSEPEALSVHSEAKDKPSSDAGTKSIRGAPSDGADTATEDAETDIGAILRKEMRKLSA